MAETLDIRPQVVNLLCYAGDTLVLRVTTSDDYSAATWTGHVRLDYDETSPDALFSFVPDSGGAIAIVDEDDTQRLNESGELVTESGQTFRRYKGIYDVQVEQNGIVKTLFRGSISIDSDITKEP